MVEGKTCPVSELVGEIPLSVSLDTPIKDAAKLMKDKDLSAVVVTKNQRVTGIITEKDITRRVVAKNLDASKTSVKEIMTKNLISVPPGTSLAKAATIMKTKKIRHLPIVQKGLILGVVTAMDILEADPKCISFLTGNR